MTSDPGDWLDLERELQAVLAEGVEIGGTVEESDISVRVGRTTVELVIELSDLEASDQAGAYLVLCDLLATRRTQGADQVVGCLVFVTEPDTDALVTALTGMTRDSEMFTPVLALSRTQAGLLATACTAGVEFIDDAVALIAVAADHQPPTSAVAQTLLDEVDELIDRRTSPTQ